MAVRSSTASGLGRRLDGDAEPSVGSFVLVELVVDRGGDVFEAFELA
jgi:hypothetical protein